MGEVNKHMKKIFALLQLIFSESLTIATFISRRNQVIAATIISTVVITFGVVTYYAGKTEFDPQPDFYSTLVPPYANVVAGGSVDQFLQKSEKIFLSKTNGQ